MVSVSTVIILNGLKSELVASTSATKQVVQSIVTIYSVTDAQNPNKNSSSGTDPNSGLEPGQSVAVAFATWALSMLEKFGIDALPSMPPDGEANPMTNYTNVPQTHVVKNMTIVATNSAGQVVPGAEVVPPSGDAGATVILPHGQNITVTVVFTYGPP
jgi:hypothetical protein